MNQTHNTLLVCVALLLLPVASADPLLGPTAPTDLVATAGPAAGEISLTWAPAESLGGVTAYNIYHVDEEGAATLIATVDGETLAFTETGLENGVTRTYAVSASDLVGEGPLSEPATATTFTAPDAPEDVAAAPGGLGTLGEIVVTWSAPANDGGLAIVGYNVYRNGELVATVEADATSWTDEGRDVGGEYHYVLSAFNDAGEGLKSGAVCAMASPWGILPDAPDCLGM